MAARSCPETSRARRSPCRTFTRRSASIRSAQMSDEDLDDARAGRLSVGRRLRRAVHRQHHGDRLGSDRPGAALFGRRAGALRNPRQVLHAGRRDDHGPDRQEHPPARHRHPQGAGECRRRGRRHRRLDQCRAASAGDRARMRHRVRSVRRRRNLQKDTVYRGFETGRPLCRQGYVRSWRRAAADEDLARSRLHARRLPDRHRPHHRREHEEREMEPGPGRGASGRQAVARRPAAWSA